MDFENIINMINFDFLLESIGFLFGLELLWHFFFQNWISSFLSLFITTTC